MSIQDIFEDGSQRGVYLSEKIVNLLKLIEIVEDSRHRGKKIVFTNGCFDILHMGHVAVLRKAKNLGDLLIVGLNSDASVRRLKGRRRPIMPIEERAAILASLTCVDHITVFEDDTPVNLLMAIKPDILVKGNDYTKEQVVGGDVVVSYGGRVELVELVSGVSTTSIIDRIIESRNAGNKKV